MDRNSYNNSPYKDDIELAVRSCDAMRSNAEDATDISLEEYVQKRWGTSFESYMDSLGINTSTDTIQNITSMPDPSVRWLIPEIFRNAIRLGLRKEPLWPNIIAAEQTVKQLQFVQPYFNISDAIPKKVKEAETIQFGELSFGSKTIKIAKIGRAIRVTYEVIQYVAMDLVGIYLQDFGVKLNLAIDTLMISTLINGEQVNGSESCPVVGIQNTGTGISYIDLLTIWVRMVRIGKNPTAIIGGETAAINTLNLPEFKTPMFGQPIATLDLKTPLPRNTAYFIHGAIPANQQMIIDRSATIIKYNAQPLLLETEKIVSNQTEATYASITTGFGIVFRDAHILADSSLDFSSHGFPSYMDPTIQENAPIV